MEQVVWNHIISVLFFLHFQKSPSTSVIRENVAALFCCAAPQNVFFRLKLSHFSIGIHPLKDLWYIKSYPWNNLHHNSLWRLKDLHADKSLFAVVWNLLHNKYNMKLLCLIPVTVLATLVQRNTDDLSVTSYSHISKRTVRLSDTLDTVWITAGWSF